MSEVTYHSLEYTESATESEGQASVFKIKRKPISSASSYTVKDADDTVRDSEGFEQPFLEEERPAQLGRFSIEQCSEIVIDVLAILSVVPFFVLAVAAGLAHNRQTTEDQSSVFDNATKLASTLFTTVFAAVVGRASLRYGLLQLQRGATIGKLEQLVQSRTVIGTLGAQLQFRAWSILGCFLLVLWALSPIGSQAPLRLLSTTLTPVLSTRTIDYVNTMANDAYDAADDVSWIITSVTPVYVTSLLSPPNVKNGSVDLWGNLKIPYLSQIQNGTEDSWRYVLDESNMASTYSSLIGLPIDGLDANATEFFLETTYIRLNCSEVQQVPNSKINVSYDINSPNGTFRGVNLTEFVSDDALRLPDWTIALDVFVDHMYYTGGYPGQFGNDTTIEANQGTLLFQDYNGTRAYCGVNQEYVESKVTCYDTGSGPGCEVTAQRESQLAHPPSAITSLSFPGVFEEVAINWITATGERKRSAISSIAEYYLQDPTTSFILSNNNDDYADFSNVSAQDFGDRLGQLLNTFMLAGQIARNISSGTGTTGLETTATLTTYHEVYVCSWPWLFVLCLSSTAMLSAALLSLWWQVQIHVPDILGYFSSTIRDSRYLNLGGGSTLDGMRLAKVLKNYKVRLGVVDEPGNKLGRLAIAKADEVTAPVKGAYYY